MVDDDKTVLHKVCQFITEACSEEINLSAFKIGKDFFQDKDNLMYDIVFLDIDMPEITGFELAQALKMIKPNITIVFVSNLEHLVFQSFSFKPFRFVRKSHLEEDILSAVEAYQKELNATRDVYIFKTNNIEKTIMTSDIIYFESMGHDVFIQTINNKYKIKREHGDEKSIKTISEQLKTKGFIRVHRSYLVNFRYIYLINRDDITLKNSEKIRINPHKSNEIKNNYQKFLMMEV